MNYYYNGVDNSAYLAHYGVLGMKWGQHLFGDSTTSSFAKSYGQKYLTAAKNKAQNRINAKKSVYSSEDRVNAAKEYLNSVAADRASRGKMTSTRTLKMAMLNTKVSALGKAAAGTAIGIGGSLITGNAILGVATTALSISSAAKAFRDMADVKEYAIDSDASGSKITNASNSASSKYAAQARLQAAANYSRKAKAAASGAATMERYAQLRRDVANEKSKSDRETAASYNPEKLKRENYRRDEDYDRAVNDAQSAHDYFYNSAKQTYQKYSRGQDAYNTTIDSLKSYTGKYGKNAFQRDQANVTQKYMNTRADTYDYNYGTALGQNAYDAWKKNFD